MCHFFQAGRGSVQSLNCICDLFSLLQSACCRDERAVSSGLKAPHCLLQEVFKPVPMTLPPSHSHTDIPPEVLADWHPHQKAWHWPRLGAAVKKGWNCLSFLFHKSRSKLTKQKGGFSMVRRDWQKIPQGI